MHLPSFQLEKRIVVMFFGSIPVAGKLLPISSTTSTVRSPKPKGAMQAADGQTWHVAELRLCRLGGLALQHPRHLSSRDDLCQPIVKAFSIGRCRKALCRALPTSSAPILATKDTDVINAPRMAVSPPIWFLPRPIEEHSWPSCCSFGARRTSCGLDAVEQDDPIHRALA